MSAVRNLLHLGEGIIAEHAEIFSAGSVAMSSYPARFLAAKVDVTSN